MKIDSPLGPLTIYASDKGITGICFGSKRQQDLSAKAQKHAEQCANELKKYFDGTLSAFTFALDMNGTEFQKKIWKALYAVKLGKSITYGELAKKAGYPGAARAVGSAMRVNPVCIVVPCHRVLPSSGGIGNYNGGVSKKKWLLEHEKKS